MKFRIGIVFLFCSVLAFGQNQPQTSQYLIHPVLANPAAVTIRSGMNGAFLYQKQWAGFENSPTTMYANFNVPLKGHHNYVGGFIVSDQVSVHSRYKIAAIYAHKVKLDASSYFSFGVTPGFDVIQTDYSKVQTDFANDPIMSSENRSIFSFNSGAGVNYYTKKLWLGVSIPAIFKNFIEGQDKQQISFSLRDMTYQFIAGWKTDLGKLITFKPSTMVRYNIGAPLQFDLNALFEYREQIGLGVSYRSKTTLNILANYRITKDFKLGYAYAMQMGSQLNEYHSGTHEVALIYGVGNNRKANINLPKKINQYRKKKTKEIKKALKKADKERKAKEKQEQKDAVPLEPGGKSKKQPYS